MPRLFAGLELPEEQRQRLALIKGPLPGAKWVSPADMHLTLRFAGDVDNHVADEFAGFMSEIALEPFEVRVTGLGTFGGREPRVIHAEVEGGLALQHLQRAVDRAARAAGVPPEARSFTPHVTLARLRGTNAEAVARLLGASGLLRLAPFVVARFVLFSSRPRQGGGPYVIEQAYALGHRADAHWQAAD